MKMMGNSWKLMDREINEDLWKFIQMMGNSRKWWEIHENSWQFMEIREVWLEWLEIYGNGRDFAQQAKYNGKRLNNATSISKSKEEINSLIKKIGWDEI